ncbi:hypothetical protein [Bacillus sp. FSL K6-2944]|uniref:hypothetical protein n=1 Tax=Bacillus sp. FSL K6-2944 TaxID=2921486 RepID=UPI0030F81409
MRKKMESIPLSFLSNQCIYQRNKWNRDKIIKKLQMLYKQRADISDSALQKKHTDLYSAIFRIFGKGGHRKAILEANLPYKHIRKKVACRNWDEEFIIQSLQVLYKLEVDISSSNLKKIIITYMKKLENYLKIEVDIVLLLNCLGLTIY